MRQSGPQPVAREPSAPLLLQQPGAAPQGNMWAQSVQQQHLGPDTSPAAQSNGSTTCLDIGVLGAALQKLLVSLPPIEGPSSSSTSAPVVLQLQDMQQAAPVVLQPAQQPVQQVYTLPSGKQLLVGGTTAGAIQQHTAVVYTGHTAGVGDGAGCSLVLQPLQDGQFSYYRTDTEHHTQAVFHTAGTAVNHYMPGPLTSGHPFGQPLSSGCQQLGVCSSRQVTAANCSSTPHETMQLPAWPGTADSSSTSAARRTSVVCILSGPSAPSPPAGAISYSSAQEPLGVAAPVSSSAPSPAGPGLQLVPISSQQQAGRVTDNRLLLGHQPPSTGPPGGSTGGGYGRMQQHAAARFPVQPLPARGRSGLQAAMCAPSWQAAAGAGAGSTASTSTAAAPARVLPGPWVDISLEEALPQLWSNEQVQQARGGSLSNTQLRAAWHAAGDPELCAQDMYDFRKLKHVLHKLDAKHSVRLNLIKRLHAVADYGGCDLKAVYFEVRCVIGGVMRACSGGLEGARVTGLVRLALVLQEALALGPREVAGSAVAVQCYA